LEQLRALYYGIKIIVGETDVQPGHGVDVQTDLIKVEQLLQSQTVNRDNK
jgi:CMP-2-keto-3-deoxyoctulosonic acid synthetase